MRKLPKIFIMGALFFAFCASASADQVFTGEISVGSVTGAPGETVAVPVYLNNNNIDIMSLTVPLKYSSSALEVESISFAGTLLKPNMTPLVLIDNDNQFLRFTYKPVSGLPLISETEGLLATINFTINVSAADQVVSIDSVNDLVYSNPELEWWVRLEVADSSGVDLFIPDPSNGTVTVKSVLDADDDFLILPEELELSQNYPNPFNPSTTIGFTLPERSHVLLTIYNILGQEVETLVDEVMNPGAHEVNWQASNHASGVYFYRLIYRDRVLTKKMALLK